MFLLVEVVRSSRASGFFHHRSQEPPADLDRYQEKFMGADQIAELRPALREIFGSVTGSTDCVTFEVDGEPDIWAQVTFDHLNIYYPLSREPEEELTRRRGLPMAALELVQWEPNQFATFTHTRDVDALAALMDAYLGIICSSGQEYSLNIRFEDLG